MENPRKFVFLFPEKGIFDFEIEDGSRGVYKQWEKNGGQAFEPWNAKTKEEEQAIQRAAQKDLAAFFRPIYTKKLNSCMILLIFIFLIPC